MPSSNSKRRCRLNHPSSNPVPAAKSDSADADITVVGGAGHVGIPLVLAFAEAGMTVNVNDLNEATLATLRAGKLPFIEHGAAPLLAKALAENKTWEKSITQTSFNGVCGSCSAEVVL